MPTKNKSAEFVTVRAMYGNFGTVVYFENDTASYQAAWKRKQLKKFFKGKHLKTLLINKKLIGYAVEKAPLNYKQVYSLSQVSALFYAANTGKKTVAPPTPLTFDPWGALIATHTMPPELVNYVKANGITVKYLDEDEHSVAVPTSSEPEPDPNDRPLTPVNGDYVLLVSDDSRHTEDFTFANTLIETVAGDVEMYIIEDMYGVIMHVEPLPERDQWPRKSWKRIPTPQTGKNG